MMDWTYDLFIEDSKLYSATNEEFNDASNYNRYFMIRFKNCANEFKKNWLESHIGLYDDLDGWVGDAFIDAFINTGWFSDFYKDTYGQRPHLPDWYYLQAVNLPSKEDVTRKFCSSPVEDAMEDAKRAREEV